MIDLLRALAVLAERPRQDHQRVADAVGIPLATPSEHADLFQLELFPYASVHLGAEGKLGGSARDRVSGFVSTIGIEPTADVDHLVTMLGIYAAILARQQVEASDQWSRVCDAFLVEHLLPWMPGLLGRVRSVGSDSYCAWADLLDALLEAHAAKSGLISTLLPVHLERAPALSDPRSDGADALIEGLLAPARSGFILSRSDLSSVARATKLGQRVGERRFVLRELLRHDPPGVLASLADLARNGADDWSDHWLASTPTGQWWHERAMSTSLLLRSVADEARVDINGVTDNGSLVVGGVRH